MKETDLRAEDDVSRGYRYFLGLSYRGEAFHGWQRQPNAVSVQQRIEESLSTIMRREIKITGAGRTDTGVNARVMMAHFDVPEPIDDPRRLLRSLARLSGRDIAFYSLRRVRDEANARFDATSRTYRYFVTGSYNPFIGKLAWTPGAPLDYDRMNAAAELLLSVDDFTSFAKLHADAKTNICDVREACWSSVVSDILPSGMMQFTITADRFLRNMVRAVVGTLVEVGRGKMSIDDFRNVIAAKDRCAAGTSMPPTPLFLWDITYPDDIFID